MRAAIVGVVATEGLLAGAAGGTKGSVAVGQPVCPVTRQRQVALRDGVVMAAMCCQYVRAGRTLKPNPIP